MEAHIKEYDVFICYRWGKNGENRLARLLKERFVRKGLRVFLDLDELSHGNYLDKIDNIIRSCPNFVIALTYGFFDRGDGDPAEDVGRLEISIALAAQTRIVVVTEGDPKFVLQADRVPPELVEMTRLNAIQYSHKEYDAFMERVVAHLDLSASKGQAEDDWKAMEEVIKSEGYILWQNHYLKQAYYTAVSQDLHGVPAAFPTVNGIEYPIIYYRSANPAAPFEHRLIAGDDFVVRSPRELPDLNASPRPAIPEWVRQNISRDGEENRDRGSLRLRYFQLLSLTKRVRRWNMRGFALSNLELDGNNEVAKLEATLCTYGENCLTSHVMIYQLYHKYLDRDVFTAHEEILNHYFSKLSQADTKPCLTLVVPEGIDFYPLISVQAILVFRNRNREWQVMAVERADTVAIASGFWQLPPAGGFEIYGTEREKDIYVRKQFDIRLALIREFLEEIFGDNDLTGENPKVAASGIAGSPGYEKIMDSLDECLTRIHFLGVVTELVTMRSELSFLIVIDDPSILKLRYQVVAPAGEQSTAHWEKGSSESKRLHPLKFSELQEVLRPPQLWHSSSIGLLKLFSEHLMDTSGWLKKLYPDLPDLDLSS